MKRTLSIFLSLTLLVFTVCPAFARGFGGGFSSSRGFSSGRSFSSGFSSRSSFTSTRSLSSSYSRGVSSTPSFSFTKSTPKTVSFTRPTVTPSTSSYRYIKTSPTRVVNKTVVVHHYDNGVGVSNLVTNMLLLHALTSGNNQNVNINRSDLINIKHAMLKCYDQGGGRSCITDYL